MIIMNTRQIIIYNLFSSLVLGGFTSPNNGETFNFTHVLFEWEQEQDANSYNLIVYNDEEEIANIIDSTLATVIDIFDWDKEYFIKIRTINQNGQFSTWIDSLQIITMPVSDEYDSQIFLLITKVIKIDIK